MTGEGDALDPEQPSASYHEFPDGNSLGRGGWGG